MSGLDLNRWSGMKKFISLSVLMIFAVSCNHDTSDPHYTFSNAKSAQNEYRFKDIKEMRAAPKKRGMKKVDCK